MKTNRNQKPIMWKINLSLFLGKVGDLLSKPLAILTGLAALTGSIWLMILGEWWLLLKAVIALVVAPLVVFLLFIPSLFVDPYRYQDRSRWEVEIFAHEKSRMGCAWTLLSIFLQRVGIWTWLVLVFWASLSVSTPATLAPTLMVSVLIAIPALYWLILKMLQKQYSPESEVEVIHAHRIMLIWIWAGYIIACWAAIATGPNLWVDAIIIGAGVLVGMVYVFALGLGH